MDRHDAPAPANPYARRGTAALLAVFALALLLGFWQLCRWQVAQAQARHAALHAERVASSDCSAAVIVDADGRTLRPAPGLRCADVRQIEGRPAD